MKDTLKYDTCGTGTGTFHIISPCAAARMAKHVLSKVNKGFWTMPKNPYIGLTPAKQGRNDQITAKGCIATTVEEHGASLGKLE